MQATGVFDHPWLSGLFGDPEMAGIWSPDAQLQHLLRFEAAWSRALAQAGRISPAEGSRLGTAIEGFAPDIASLARGTATDGLPIPDLVRQLKEALGEAGVHTGATSQDVIDTALALTMRDTLAVLTDRLARIDEALADLDAVHGTNAMMGRTRMQAATPIRVADRIAKWRAPLGPHRERIEQALPRIARLQVGGASGDRAALGADSAAILATLETALGLPAGAKAWHATREPVGECASLLALVTGSLGTLGQDICLMTQQGLDEITLAGGGGSSAMPHKSNPVAAELLVTLARFNATQIAGIQQAMIHEQERSGSAWALEWMVLPQMALAAGRATTATLDLLASVTHIGGRP